MSIIGEPWAASGPPKVFVAQDGRTETHEVHEFGLLISDEGGATQVVHVEDTNDPDVKKIGDSFFRRIR